MSELSTSGGCLFSESGQTRRDEDDLVFRLCGLWSCLGRLSLSMPIWRDAARDYDDGVELGMS